MAIYRVEHKKIKKNLSDDFGVGPYINKLRFNAWQDSKEKHESTKHRPSPQNDKKLLGYFYNKCKTAHMKYELTENEFDTNFISGFKSLKDLTSWFSPSELKKLAERGFVVKKYNSWKKKMVGEKSVMFIPNKPGSIIKLEISNVK